MSDFQRSRVVVSSPKFRPTKSGKLLVAGAVFLFFAYFFIGPDITYGFFIPLVLVAVADGFESRRLMLNNGFDVHARRAQASAPQLVELSLTANAGLAPLHVTPLQHPGNVRFAAEPLFISAGQGAQSVPVTNGWVPIAMGYTKFELSMSAFGFIEARQMAVFTPPRTMGQVPAFDPVDKTLTAIANDDVGRIREYVPGDRRSRVSWVTTARTGSLHVRDTSVEEFGQVEVIVEVERLRKTTGGRGSQLKTLSLAGGVVTNFLDQGMTVQLHTIELAPAFYREQVEAQLADLWSEPSLEEAHPYVTVKGAVSSRSELIRRLSLAQAGRVPRPPGPRIEIDSRGWRRVQ